MTRAIAAAANVQPEGSRGIVLWVEAEGKVPAVMLGMKFQSSIIAKKRRCMKED